MQLKTALSTQRIPFFVIPGKPAPDLMRGP
jgi:hypothetical protein